MKTRFMKITIDSNQSRHLRLWGIFGIFTVFAVVYMIGLQSSVPSVAMSEIGIEQVQQGPLDIHIPVFGRYASRYERLISAPSNGQIEEILVRTGAEVDSDTIIAQLTNPDLRQQYTDATNHLKRLQSEQLVVQLQVENEQLAFQAELADIENQLQTAQLDVDVNTRLADQGIAAKIELERANLRLNQLQQRLHFANYRYEKQQEMHQLQLQQKEIDITQQQQHTNNLSNKVEHLVIRAGIAGTLQQLDIVLGQRVVQGQTLARVGSKRQLMARLNIPQRFAERVAIGAPVSVRHDNRVLKAEISQLASVVENGFIIAEAYFQNELPNTIRPAQPINANVFVEHLSDALYIEQRAGMQPLSSVITYKQDEEQNALQQIKLTFGERTGSHIVINKGASNGEHIVINDLSQWHDYPQLTVTH